MLNIPSKKKNGKSFERTEIDHIISCDNSEGTADQNFGTRESLIKQRPWLPSGTFNSGEQRLKITIQTRM